MSLSVCIFAHNEERLLPRCLAALDAAAGLWCTNAGHNRDPIVQAIQAQAATLDFAPTFQFVVPPKEL